ncbi:MAG TPA: XrtA system polysaccharide chain length determinant [Thermodesulfobacteriota bacterium]
MELPNSEYKKHLRVLLKRKFLFMALAISLMSLVVWGSYFMPKKYEAQSTVFIESNVIRSLVGGIAITPSMSDRIRVLRYAMLSRGLIYKAIKDLDIDTTAANDKAVEKMITSFQERTKISVKGNDLFIVSIRDGDPRLATDFVNSLVRSYVEENVAAKREEAYGANTFLDEQVTALKEKVDKAEEEIVRFRQSRGVFVSIDERSLIGDIKNYRTEIENIDLKRNEFAAAKKNIKRQLDGTEPITNSAMKRTQSGAAVTSIENKIKQLLVVYTENYPEVVKLKVELDSLKKLQSSAPPPKHAEEDVTDSEEAVANPIYKELRQKYLTLESDISSLDARRAQLAALTGRRESDLRVLPADRKRLAELEQERNANKDLYEQLSQRLAQSEFSKKMEIEDKSTTFRIVDPAVVSTVPVNPRLKIMLAGIMIGLIGAVAGVILREQLDSSVKDLRSVKALGFEVLAAIPKMTYAAANKKRVKREMFAYSIAGFFVVAIFSTIALEIANPAYVDNMIASLELDLIRDNVIDAAKRIF